MILLEINKLYNLVALIKAGVNKLTFAYNSIDYKAKLSFIVIKC